MIDLFKDYISLSGEMRRVYPNSLADSDPEYSLKISNFWPFPPPRLITAIYSQVSGTKRGIQDQSLMDFLPGYRLIHIDELSEAYFDLAEMSGKNDCFPFLANYSSDYICMVGDGVVSFMHDDIPLILMHETGKAFLKSVCEFYKRGIYFLDEFGYLDYDPEGQGVCGAELNPGIAYWVE